MKPDNFGKTDYNKNKPAQTTPSMKNPHQQPAQPNKGNWTTDGGAGINKIPKDKNRRDK